MTTCGTLIVLWLMCPLSRLSDPQAYALHGECDTGCHSGLWIKGECEEGHTRHQSIWVYEGKEPRLDEWAVSTNVISYWLERWREENGK